MRLIGYVRVSRVAGREGDSFISPAVQRERCESLAAAHGHTIIEWREDLDQPGSRYSRPGFQDAIEVVERGEADGIIVASLDRFARSVPDAAVALQRLEDVGGTLISVRDSLDTSTPIGRFARTMMLALAELELDRIRENWRIARDRAIARGVYIASRTPLGYQRRPDGGLEPDPQTARAVRELFRRRGRGESWRELCEWLDRRLPREGAWRIATVSDMIRRRAYLGEARIGDAVNPTAHKPLVTRAVWESAQGSTGPVYAKKGALLSGLARCASCGFTMTANRDGTRGYSRYDCRTRHASGVCPAPVGISMPRLDAHVQASFFGWIDGNETAIQAAAATDLLERAVARVEAAELELAEYRDANLVSVIGRDAYVAGLEERAVRVAAARSEVVAARRGADIGVLRVEIREVWDDLDLGERRHLLRAAIDTVAIRRAHLRGQGTPVDERTWIFWRGDGPQDLPGRGAPMRPILFPNARPE